MFPHSLNMMLASRWRAVSREVNTLHSAIAELKAHHAEEVLRLRARIDELEDI